jgi:hypothetical protein
MMTEPPVHDSQLTTPARRPWWARLRTQVKLALIAAVVVFLAAVGVTGYLVWHHPSQPPPAQARPPSRQSAQPAAPPLQTTQPAGPALQTAAPRAQTVLPFTGLAPEGVAVDTAGNIYVADGANNRVLKLAAGSSIQTALPFAGLNHPDGVAVDAAGQLYVVDGFNHRVLKLAAGSSTPTELPFTGLNGPSGVAVDAAGNIYVTDWIDNHTTGVKMLAAGSNAQSVLPFGPLHGRAQLAVDHAGNVYVVSSGPVLELAAGAHIQNGTAVYRPRQPVRCGGRCRRQPLRDRIWQLGHRGVGNGGGLGSPDRAAVHWPLWRLRCGGGQRGRRLRHRQ